jgi:hypothetical protein
MEALRRRYRREQSDEAWIAPLATALQSAHIVYLVGSVFVGIAFQPFAYMLVGVQIGFDGYVKRKYAPGKAAGFVRRAEATRAVPA